MALGTSDDIRVLQALYSAPNRATHTAWDEFLHLLAQHTRAERASLWIDGLDGVRAFGDAPVPPAEGIPTLRRLRSGRVYSAQDTPDRLPLPQSPLRLLRVSWHRTRPAWLILTRTTEDFRAADTAFLSSLAPHLPVALELWDEQLRKTALAEEQSRLLRHLSVGWIGFDAAGRVVALDRAAEGILLGTSGVNLSAQGALTLATPDKEAQLARTLEAARQAPRALTISDAPPLDLVLRPLIPGSAAADAWPDLRVEGHLRSGQPVALSAKKVADLLDIPLSEARLAVALTRGATLAEAADTLGLTIETARNYSKKIFARTGLRSQPELLRRLLGSPLWED